MPRRYYNPFDKASFLTIPEVVKYVSKNYKDKIPKKYKDDIDWFMYDFRNGPGKCQICGAPTKWDPKNKRYNILCEPISVQSFLSDPFRVIRTFFMNKGNSCKDVVRKNFVENATKKDGKFNYMTDAGFQKKLLASRKIAKLVDFKGKEYTVMGSYEELFLKVCGPLFWSPDEVEAPGIEITWKDENGTERIHIADFYLPKLKCVISIKDGGDNKNNHPSMVKRRKDDAYKFKAIIDKTDYNAIELNGKEEILQFNKILKELKESIKENKRFIIYPEYYSNYFPETSK